MVMKQMTQTPIKRHKSLRPLSREHHDGLLLCWKIRRGIQKQVDPGRIGRYVQYYLKTHLEPHFRIEEQAVFPVLGQENEMVRQALDDHNRLRSLRELDHPNYTALELIQQQLEKHIRFEERVLFQELQKVATPHELQEIETNHETAGPEESWTDRFWQ